MVETIALALVVVKTVTLLLGGLITVLAYRAHRRTGIPALWSLAIGFGFVTAGAATAGVVDQFLALDTQVAIVVEGAVTVVGFGIITYSLYRP